MFFHSKILTGSTYERSSTSYGPSYSVQEIFKYLLPQHRHIICGTQMHNSGGKASLHATLQLLLAPNFIFPV